ncbi:hypothetical protein [Paenibacillus elgii]|uniref:hypothetical protein n=1 Tax=Paenibacillus elgii TaxID=189691 RepID=UPI000248DAF7|nr:hypothetical protein [Paenibacillus elgii]
MHSQNDPSKFRINNPLLKATLFGGYMCEESRRAEGWVSSDQYFVSRSMLTHLVERLFNIHRLPGFHEEYRFNSIREKRESYKLVSTGELEDALEELKQLYEHTQKWLQTEAVNGKIRLGRSLRSYEKSQVAHQLLDKAPTIKYYYHTINSYSTSAFLGGYVSPILLERDVPIEDVLIHYKYVDFDYVCSFDVENEVWVINKHPMGLECHPFEIFRFFPDRLSRKNAYGSETNLWDMGYTSIGENEISIKEDMNKYYKPCEHKYVKIVT